MSFSWGRFRFIDSAQFLSASLDCLVSATPDDAFLFSSGKVRVLMYKSFLSVSFVFRFLYNCNTSALLIIDLNTL